jgi:hypothetical protein
LATSLLATSLLATSLLATSLLEGGLDFAGKWADEVGCVLVLACGLMDCYVAS